MRVRGANEEGSATERSEVGPTGLRRTADVVARAALFASAVAILIGTFVTSCAGSRGTPSGPLAAPPPPAVEAFREARRALREETLSGRAAGPELDARIRAALERAAAADPAWVAPRRLLDERARSRLAGTHALAERRAALAERQVTAGELYLAGRLENAEGSRRFPMAAALEPSLAWPRHALSVDREMAGQLAAAVELEREAVARAYGGYELAYFARRYAGLLERTRRPERARALLTDVLRDPRLGPLDRHEVALTLTRSELAFEAPTADNERGLRRALTLIADGTTAPLEVASLLEAVGRAPNARPASALRLDLVHALRAHPRFTDDVELLDVARIDGPFAAATLLAERSRLPGARPPTPWAALVAAFERDDVEAGIEAGIEAWTAALPRQVLDADGRPRDPRIAAVVDAARSANLAVEAERLGLAERCLDAGWIGPTVALVEGLDADASDAARAAGRALAERALAARALLDEIAQLLDASMGETPMFRPAGAAPQRSDDGESQALAWAEEAALEAVPENLDVSGLLDELAALVRRRAPQLGWVDENVGAEDLATAVVASPVLRFGPFGAVLVPGPRFAERDATLGIGAAGERVPGLAQVLDRLGRMGLFGQPPFRPIDGTLMRRLAAYERSGEHLGVPWNGMIVYCDGVEAASSRGRSGLSISGAALHEGYWIDIQAERERLAGWRAWQRELAERGLDWARGVVREFVLPLDLGAGGEARFERARMAPPLGAAEVARLALLVERAEAAGGVPEDGRDLVTLDELVEVVGNHEEGHLTDRTRFLPLSRNPLGVAGLAAGELFQPLEIERRLEYRAQAIALATVPDPRLALDNLLEAAAVDARLPTVHAHAYRRLLADVLTEWNARLEADADAWPDVDRDAYLLHQVHRLTPDELRSIAVEVARREGLVR